MRTNKIVRLLKTAIHQAFTVIFENITQQERL